MPKKDSYLEQLQRRREAANAPPPPAKKPAEMTAEELRDEISRTNARIRSADERAVEAGREVLAGGSGSVLGKFWAPRRRRRPWK